MCVCVCVCVCMCVCVCACVQVVLLQEKTPSKQFVMPNEVQTDIVEDDELLH